MKTKQLVSIGGVVAIGNLALLTLVVIMSVVMHQPSPKGAPNSPFEIALGVASAVLLFPVGWLIVLVPVLSFGTLLPWKFAMALGLVVFGGLNALLWGKAVDAIVKRRKRRTA